MKKMNLFLLAILLISTSPLIAQFGAHAGAVFSTLKEETDGGDSEKSDAKTGFTAGVFYRKQLGGVLGLQPEINWVQRGGKYSESGYEADLILNYLEVPVYLLYTGGNTSGFYAGAGPSFNFGMSGKVNDSDGEDFDINFGGNEDDDLKGFFMAINAMAGYQLKNGINLNTFISQSITNSSTYDSDGYKTNLFSFGVRVGYMFGGSEEARNSKVRIKHVL